MIHRWSSYAEFLATAEIAKDNYWATQARDKWAGGHYTQALNLAINGDDSRVSEAERLLDQLESVDYGERTREWQPSVSGAYPVVPEYLAGHPQCMREPRETDNLAPVSIYCATTISAGLSADQIMTRGTAILALVLKLQKVRSVDLYATCEVDGQSNGDYISVIPIESRPLSLAHAANALTGLSFPRRLTYTIAHMHDGYQGGWPITFRRLGYGDNRYIAWISKQLGLTDSDLYIKPGYSDDELINEPVKWINTQLERYNSI